MPAGFRTWVQARVRPKNARSICRRLCPWERARSVLQEDIMAPKHLGWIPILTTALVLAADWPQFRGPNASGVSDETNLPVEFGPDRNVVWTTAIPPGNSSPSVAGDKIFLTAVENDKLFTIALDRATGRILWRREAPRPRKQVIERPANGPVSGTPVSDDTNVYVFFVDFGLLAYGADGNEMWR